MMTFIICIFFAAVHGGLIASILLVISAFGMLQTLWRMLLVFLSFFSQRVVCKYDLHDWDDGIDSDPKRPLHFYPYTCKHCAKEFYV